MFYIKACTIRVNKFEIICSDQYHKNHRKAWFFFYNSETFSLNRTESQIMKFLIAINQAVSCGSI